MKTFDFLRKHSRTLQIIGGISMIIVGIALLTGAWNYFISWSQSLVADFGTTVI